MGLTFEWTVKLGDILTMAGAVMVAAAFLYNRGGKEAGDQMSLNALSKEFKEMKTEFKTFSETLQKIAVQETKIELLMQWYDELRRGLASSRSRAAPTLTANTSADASHQAPRQPLPDLDHRRHLRPSSRADPPDDAPAWPATPEPQPTPAKTSAD
jgi:hypothetical protein